MIRIGFNNSIPLPYVTRFFKSRNGKRLYAVCADRTVWRVKVLGRFGLAIRSFGW